MALRDYQIQVVDQTVEALLKHKRVALTSPTGAGKSIMAQSVIESIQGRAVVVVHTRGLMKQWAAKGLDCVTVQKAIATPAVLKGYTLMVVDEAHHYVHNTYEKVVTSFKGMVLGMSATFSRATDYHGFKHIYRVLIAGAGKDQLQNDSFLVSAVVRFPGIEDAWDGESLGAHVAESITGGNARQYKDCLDWAIPYIIERKTVIFARSINQVRAIVGYLNSKGLQAAPAVGPDSNALTTFESDGPGTVLVTVQLISEGIDLPSCDTVVLLRRMGSPVAAAQAVGRAMRPHPGKIEALVLDYCGTMLEHGHPNIDSVSSLDARNEDKAPNCENCGEPLMRPSEPCPECGALLETTKGASHSYIPCPLCMSRLDKNGRCPKCNQQAVFYQGAGDPSMIIVGGVKLEQTGSKLYRGEGWGAPIYINLESLEGNVGTRSHKAKNVKGLIQWLVRTISAGRV